MGEVAKLPEQHSTALTPMDMLQIAVDKGADLDQLTKLMDLNERWEANEARKAFVVAKAAFKAEAPRIDKNKAVDFTSQKGRTHYRHATLDHVEHLLSPILSKHGLTYSWETEQTDAGLIRVTCILTHTLGHSERVSLQAGADNTGNKNSIQAIGSTATFLSRYTLLLATGMATREMDDDGGGADKEPITDEQKQKIVTGLKETGADVKAFCKYMGVEAVDQIAVKDFGKATKALEAKRAKK